MHPLKAFSLLSWLCLLVLQASLLLPASGVALYWSAVLVAFLLVPMAGLFRDKRYTYKWIGFLTLIYFCIGVSELVSNPALRIYGFGTTLSSVSLFLASIYYARYLNLKNP